MLWKYIREIEFACKKTDNWPSRNFRGVLSVSQKRYHLNIRKIPWYCWWLVCWRMSIMVHTMLLISLRDMVVIQRAGSILVILPYLIYPPSTLRSLHVFILLHVAIFQTLKVTFQGKNSPVQKSIFVMYWYVVKKVVQFQMFVVVGFIARCFHLSWRISSESRGLSHPPVDPRAARLMVKAARCRLTAQCLTGCQTGWR